jgi:hypothetical protein
MTARTNNDKDQTTAGTNNGRNKQRQEQATAGTTAGTSNGRNKQRQEQATTTTAEADPLRG